MNFFESQDSARKNTNKLVFLFILAVISLIIMTNLLVMVIFGYLDNNQNITTEAFLTTFDWQTFSAIGVGVIVVILAGSLYKIAALSSGGKVVAESLGGQLIAQNTDDFNQRKLLNVVEEMAIASGTPVPPVYLLRNEPGINAFAAGFTPRDAVIGITEGAIEQLNREQLQGVIAHEFSHIFNGDMRLNLRLIGVLHGILVIGIIGYYILRSSAYSSRRRNDRGGGLIALGLGLMVIGFAGTFFGRLIKASVSRQREYLADASAVQFTRNPHGIAGALKKIGGFMAGSRIESPAGQEVSHAFFSEGVPTILHFLLATHPPLADRIRRIEPGWDGKFDRSIAPTAQPVGEQATAQEAVPPTSTAKIAAAVSGAAVIDALGAVEQVGNPDHETINYARALIGELPATLKDLLREPYGARAVMYALVLHRPVDIRNAQLDYIREHGDEGVYAQMDKVVPVVAAMDALHRIPVIELAIPALKQLSLKQYQLFKHNLTALIEIDQRINLFEWSMQKILLHHLDGHFSKRPAVKARYSRLDELRQETAVILSVLAHTGQDNEDDAAHAFAAAAEEAGIAGLNLLPINQLSLTRLEQALAKLNQLKPLQKPRLLKACVHCIAFDQRIAPAEVELLRAFSSVLDCPMPPITNR